MPKHRNLTARWAAAALAIGVTAAATPAAIGEAPMLMSYQGRLVDAGGNPVSGNVGLELRLYNVSVGGAPIYADSNMVATTDGVYSTFIGDNTTLGSLPNALTNAEVYLEVVVDGTTLGPRRRLAAGPYALNAADAEALGGLPYSAYGKLGADNVWSGSNSFSGDLTVDGPLGLTVAHDLNVGGDGFTDGRFDILGELTVGQQANIVGDLIGLGDATLNGDLTVENDLIVRGDAFADGRFDILGDLTVGQNASIVGNLTVLQDATIDQELTVQQNTIVRGNNFTDGKWDIRSNLTVGVLGGLGVATFENDLIVHGNGFTDGRFDIEGDLSVSGAALSVEHDTIIRGNTFNEGNMHIVGSLRVDGQIINPGVNHEELVITDFGAVANDAGFLDNDVIIDGLISSLPPEGGTIVIPHGDFHIYGPIEVDRNFVTIRGLNYGHQSQGEGSGGGSKLIVHGVEGIWMKVLAGEPRHSGITIRDLHIRGIDRTIDRYGIRVQHLIDGLKIDNVSCNDLTWGIHIGGADAGMITRCRLVECTNPLRIENSIQMIVNNNHMGGQAPGITCDLEGVTFATVTGNNMFPDGDITLRLLNSTSIQATGNNISGAHPKTVEILANGNTFSGNNVRFITGGGAPDGDDGLIRVDGNDNQVSANTIFSEQPVDFVRIWVNGINNHIAHNNIWGYASNRKVYVHTGGVGNRVIYTCTSGELTDTGTGTFGVFFP